MPCRLNLLPSCPPGAFSENKTHLPLEGTHIGQLEIEATSGLEAYSQGQPVNRTHLMQRTQPVYV